MTNRVIKATYVRGEMSLKDCLETYVRALSSEVELGEMLILQISGQPGSSSPLLTDFQ